MTKMHQIQGNNTQVEKVDKDVKEQFPFSN